jgi:glucose/arabinose dehydrogenase
MKAIRIHFLFFILLISGACQRSEEVILKQVMTGFEKPVHLNSPPGDPGRLFIVEVKGRIRIIKNGNLLPTPFMDIVDEVQTYGEMGLLSIAFHPNFQTNRYFYIYYIDLKRHTRVVRFQTLEGNPDVADLSTAKTIMRFKQPYKNHKGGLLKFGEDGMLYIGLGDGGRQGDPDNQSQNRGTVLGDLLRIDVDHGDPYTIPPDNPYAGSSEFRPEIWAWGLRNPWRYAFDEEENLLYIADVGEKGFEEVNVAPANAGGLNYGWNIMEGNHCFTDPNCKTDGFIRPVDEYTHKEGCAIVGGAVYRGKELSSIRGHYFYGDWCLGFIRSFRYHNGKAVDKRQWDFGVPDNITSFGEDSDHNLYVVYESGKIYRFTKKG